VTDIGGGLATTDRPGPRPAAGGRGAGRGPFGRLALFYRQVVAELRKVIWPTRKELVTYTTVVLFFVVVVTTYVALVDLAAAKSVLSVFG
jgi:preprotein translocase subunit SecE